MKCRCGLQPGCRCGLQPGCRCGFFLTDFALLFAIGEWVAQKCVYKVRPFLGKACIIDSQLNVS